MCVGPVLTQYHPSYPVSGFSIIFSAWSIDVSLSLAQMLMFSFDMGAVAPDILRLFSPCLNKPITSGQQSGAVFSPCPDMFHTCPDHTSQLSGHINTLSLLYILPYLPEPYNYSSPETFNLTSGGCSSFSLTGCYSNTENLIYKLSASYMLFLLPPCLLWPLFCLRSVLKSELWGSWEGKGWLGVGTFASMSAEWRTCML